MNSKPFLLLLAAFLLTSSPLMSATATSIDDKKAEAAGTDIEGGCGHGGRYFINHRGRIAQGLSCSNGCCSWGARKLCRRCCSSPEEFEALNNKNN